MTQQETQEKINLLLNDENYVKQLMSLGNAEAISKELEKQDIELSPDELRKINSILIKKANGELSDEELEEVAGGMGPGTACALVVVGLIMALQGGGGVYAYCKMNGC